MLFDPRHFLSSLLDDSAEFNQVNTALISIFKIDAKGIHFRYALGALRRMCFLLILYNTDCFCNVCHGLKSLMLKVKLLSSFTLVSFFKGTLGGLFSQILQGEDIVRERAIKFLSTKLKMMPDDTMTKEVEDYIFVETKKVSALNSYFYFPHIHYGPVRFITF